MEPQRNRGFALRPPTQKVVRAVAELENVSASALLERIILCAFVGKSAFSRETLRTIGRFMAIYGFSTAEGETKNEHADKAS